MKYCPVNIYLTLSISDDTSDKINKVKYSLKNYKTRVNRKPN